MPIWLAFNLGMSQSASAVFADNLKQIIERSGLSARAWALDKKLEPRNIHRIIAGTQSPTLDLVTEISSAMELEPWQLLFPHLDSSNPPVFVMSKAERELYKNLKNAAQQLPNA